MRTGAGAHPEPSHRSRAMIRVNTHIHTPWSFSSFESIEQAARLAREQDIRVLGISDFNTIDGFDEFSSACAASGVYPLYNIEFIAFEDADRTAGKRWNDPQNPGVMYICGKALAHPAVFSDDSRNKLRSLWKGTQDQIWKVVNKLNDHLGTVSVPVHLDYNTIRSQYARNTVRERHVVRALLDALRERYRDPEELRGVLRSIYGDRSSVIDLADDVALQNQARGKLLKAGAPAFIPEEPSAFLTVSDVRGIVLDGGGIPCYPVLADDKGGLGEYESDVNALCDELRRRHFHAVEFIPARNSFDHLKNYARVLRTSGFCVTFGTEHNTPDCAPMTPSARSGAAFDDELLAMSYEGACILAAHTSQVAAGKPGFVDRRGQRAVQVQDMPQFAAIGDQLIRRTLGA
jgi:hypothetical protein